MILLLGGTSDTAPLAGTLLDAGLQVLLSTATRTPLAVPEHPRLTRRAGPLDEEGLDAFLGEGKVEAVVDATHPYAQAVRAMAPAVCARRGVPYLTFVRPPAADEAEDLVAAADHDEAARLAFSWGAPVLLTTGSRNLVPYVGEARRTGLGLTVRVLDSSDSFAACRRAGIPEGCVLAGRGPFGVEENRAAIRLSRAGALVTKDGGSAGGVKEKLEAARAENCRVVLVRRPPPPAENAFSAVSDLIEALLPTVRPAVTAEEPDCAGGEAPPQTT